MDTGGTRGGILWLLGVVEEHPAEFAYDFRSRFGLSIDDLGKTYSYREALLLCAVLMRDSNSWIQSAVNGWSTPVSQEWVMLVQQFDAYVAVNSKNPKPTPMPWQAAAVSGRPTVSQERVREILDSMRPKETNG